MSGDRAVERVLAGGVRSATVEGERWVKAHARTVKGKTVLIANGERHKLPRAKLAKLTRAANAA